MICKECGREIALADFKKDDITINQLDDDPDLEIRFYCPDCEEEVAFTRIHEDDLIEVD